MVYYPHDVVFWRIRSYVGWPETVIEGTHYCVWGIFCYQSLPSCYGQEKMRTAVYIHGKGGEAAASQLEKSFSASVQAAQILKLDQSSLVETAGSG